MFKASSKPLDRHLKIKIGNEATELKNVVTFFAVYFHEKYNDMIT